MKPTTTTIRCSAMTALLAASAAAQPPRPPDLPPVPEPAENRITEAKRVLGKILFWDEQLSSDNTVACGTCHMSENGGADSRTGAHPGFDGVFGTADDIVGSPGVIRSDANDDYETDPSFGLQSRVTSRNAQNLLGGLWSPAQFWDGRAGGRFLDPETGALRIQNGGSLENQVIGPPVNDVEMAHASRDWSQITAKLVDADPLRLATNLPADVAAVLSGGTSYPDLFRTAFGDPTISATRIAFAIATYERTLVADQTPWDRFNRGQQNALTAAQVRGLDFFARSVCTQCHTPPQFTDNRFHNIGLRPWQEDAGRMEVTGNFQDRGRFKTPSLRNVGLRDNLMHVGWIDDVRDALEFYDGINGHVQFRDNQDPRIPGINIPPQVRNDLVDFLSNALTDPRVRNATFPFDRPTLLSERAADQPQIYGQSYPANGPNVIAETPLNVANPSFKVGIHGGLAGASAFLLLSFAEAAPGTAFGSLPLRVDPGRIVGTLPVVLSNSGYGTVRLRIGTDPGILGRELFGQWLVIDPSTPESLTATPGARWTAL